MRRCATIVHISSLPGEFGIGDIEEAIRLAPWFAAAGLDMQFLPLTDPADGECPYTGRSAFARNWRLISPNMLVADGLLSDTDLQPVPAFPRDKVDFDRVRQYKRDLLTIAFRHWQSGAAQDLRQQYEQFLKRSAYWLDDYALFCALKQRFHDQPWNLWPESLVTRQPQELRQAQEELRELVDYEKFVQFIFFRQWRLFRQTCEDLGIRLIGDIPIFVSYDSADVWAHQELFKLGANRLPLVVTGVPPDYFSEDGQLWGNPHYNWITMRADRFTWWVERLGATLDLVHTVRIDHFRGLDQAWEVEATASNAKKGVWVDAPGLELVQTMRERLGLSEPPAGSSAASSPIIAEDLGLITERVRSLRDKLGLPGMRVLQFGFGGGWCALVGFWILSCIPHGHQTLRRLVCKLLLHDLHLPHNIPSNCVVYTGTHDNKTTKHWWETLSRRERFRVRSYYDVRSAEINWVMIEACLASAADLAAFPLQDILGLGKEGLMNTPGVAKGNWGWRFTANVLTTALAKRVRSTVERHGRGFPKSVARI